MDKEIVYDVDGYEEMTVALRAIIDQYPGLDDGESFKFSELTDEGVAIFPTSGAIVQQERESVTGHFYQLCLYPFTVICRVSGLSQSRKVNVKEWLDMFGRWCERQPITIGEETYQLSDYPDMKGNREIWKIFRQSPAYLQTVYQDKSEDWTINMAIQYTNDFDTFDI